MLNFENGDTEQHKALFRMLCGKQFDSIYIKVPTTPNLYLIFMLYHNIQDFCGNCLNLNFSKPNARLLFFNKKISKN